MIIYDEFSVSYGFVHFLGSAWLKIIKEEKQVNRPPSGLLITLYQYWACFFSVKCQKTSLWGSFIHEIWYMACFVRFGFVRFGTWFWGYNTKTFVLKNLILPLRSNTYRDLLGQRRKFHDTPLSCPSVECFVRSVDRQFPISVNKWRKNYTQVLLYPEN